MMSLRTRWRPSNSLFRTLVRVTEVDSNSQLPRISLPRTRVDGPLSRARRGEALRRKSSILYLQMEPLLAPVSPWGPASRDDCSPLEWILVPLVGCISRDITSHPSGRVLIDSCACTQTQRSQHPHPGVHIHDRGKAVAGEIIAPGPRPEAPTG